jgi:hypothetical protein
VSEPRKTIITFEDLNDAADYAAKGPTDTPARDGRDKFAGCTFNQSLEFARHGWPDGAARAKAILERMHLPPVANKHSVTVNDVQGSYVDVGEYVQGVPECMVDFREDKRRARFATIIVNASFSWRVSVEQAIARGVSIAAVVDGLEAMGTRCRVEIVMPMRSNHSTDTSEVQMTVKHEHSPLNLDTLTFAVAHPSFLRRIVIASMDRQDDRYREAFDVGGIYGIPIDSPDVDGAIVFHMMQHHQNWSETAAVEKAREALEQYNLGMDSR